MTTTIKHDKSIKGIRDPCLFLQTSRLQMPYAVAGGSRPLFSISLWPETPHEQSAYGMVGRRRSPVHVAILTLQFQYGTAVKLLILPFLPVPVRYANILVNLVAAYCCSLLLSRTQFIGIQSASRRHDEHANLGSSNCSCLLPATRAMRGVVYTGHRRQTLY